VTTGDDDEPLVVACFVGLSGKFDCTGVVTSDVGAGLMMLSGGIKMMSGSRSLGWNDGSCAGGCDDVVVVDDPVAGGGPVAGGSVAPHVGDGLSSSGPLVRGGKVGPREGVSTGSGSWLSMVVGNADEAGKSAPTTIDGEDD
jgi:hypothetical protein